MDRYSDVVQNENGRAVSGASIQIIDQATNLLAAIFSSRDGAPQSNPFTTDELGRWSFCAADGIYKARVFMGGVLKAELPDLRLEDPTDGSAAYRAATGAALIGTTTGTVQGDISDLQNRIAALKNYTLPPATATSLGGVRIGTGLAVDGSGLVSLTYSYTLPTASASVLGGVKVGSGLGIAGDGTLFATGVVQGTVSSVNGITSAVGGNVSLTTDNLPESGAPTNQWFTAARARNAILTGLSLATNAAIVAADTMVVAFGKLQAQISANTAAIAGKDAADGYAGLTGFAINIKNAAGTIVSKLTSVATAARTIVFPDKDGTVALLSDIPASGSMVLLGQITVGSPVANIDFLTAFTSQYDEIAISIHGLRTSVNDAVSLRVCVGGVVQTASYYYASTGEASAAVASPQFLINPSITSSAGSLSAKISILNVNDTAINVDKGIIVTGGYFDSTSSRRMLFRSGAIAITSALSGFRLNCSTGNIASGTVRVYGIKNS